MTALWAPWDGPQTKQPRSRAEVIAMLGDPTGGGKFTQTEKPDPAWIKAQTVELHSERAFLPVLAGRFVRVHKLVEPYMREAFRRADISCPGYVKKAGVLVFRHMRHDPKMPLSLHSWGCAVDINSDANFAKTFPRGQEPKPWTPAWWAVWPQGMPEGVVLAFESCGFNWGGRWPEFVDPMHFQWQGHADV